MYNIFISHAWEDINVTKKIEKNLISDCINNIWVDYNSIKPGENVPVKMGEAIQWCDTIILVWSKSAEISENVTAEWTSGFINRKRIIPCAIDNTPLPPILHGLYYINFNNFEEGYNSLLCALNFSKEMNKLQN